MRPPPCHLHHTAQILRAALKPPAHTTAGGKPKITAHSSSVADAKKMLLSRQARYTGLIDGLEFAEGELADAMAGATTWVAVNADESKLASQLETAKGAGVMRVFVLLTADGPTEALSDADALKATLEASGMTWTVMRTGSMSAAGGGGGLKLDEVDMATCAEVPKEDIFRFVTEALTIEESYSRMFSLCPSADVSQLKEMRMAGCDRREEAEALLRGQIQEGALEEQAKAAEEKAAAEGAASAKSAEEEEAEREEELKELLAKAKKKGEENAIKRAEEEKLKQAEREERLANIMPEPDDDADKDGDKPAEPEASSPPSPPETPPAGDGDKPSGGDDDKPDEPPLAMA